jgi:hypothetical protein
MEFDKQAFTLDINLSQRTAIPGSGYASAASRAVGQNPRRHCILKILDPANRTK